jgi:hypothetical protein
MQRLDLREAPPFLYDVGIEFVDAPPSIREAMAPSGAGRAGAKRAAGKGRAIDPWKWRGRLYHPQLARSAQAEAPWHLVVTVEGVPCFSHHYASERAALAGWAQFKREQSRR